MTALTSTEDFINVQLAKRPHNFVDWAETVRRIPKDKYFEGAYLGTYSLTTLDKKSTLVASHHDWCGRPVSASSVSRAILASGLKKLGRKRIYWNKKSFPLLDLPQPMFCQPLEFGGRLTYVDISAAYYRIYSRIPFDIRFQGLRVFGGNVWFSDFLPNDLQHFKLARNSLVGVLRALSSTRIRGGTVVHKPNRNPYLSPEHWGFIAHLLHLLAQEAINCGACYYNTDGAIFQRDEDAIRWSNQLADWGFTPHIKLQGSGYVHSVGNYKIGATGGGRMNTRKLEHNNIIDPSPYVLKRWLEWL